MMREKEAEGSHVAEAASFLTVHFPSCRLAGVLNQMQIVNVSDLFDPLDLARAA